MKNLCSLRTIAALSASLALGGFLAPAGAVSLGQMNATAAENGLTPDSQTAGTSGTTPVTAQFIGSTGAASSSAGLTQWLANAGGGTPLDNYSSSATSWSSFTVWNTASNSAVSLAELSGVSLSFDFMLAGTGSFTLSGSSSATTSVTAQSQVLLGTSVTDAAHGGSLSISGTTASSGDINLGDGSAPFDVHLGYSNSFATPNGTSGWLFGYLNVIDGAAESSWSLKLSAVHQTGSSNPLALKFSDGTLVPILGAVPEPQTYALLALGLLVVGVRARRQR